MSEKTAYLIELQGDDDVSVSIELTDAELYAVKRVVNALKAERTRIAQVRKEQFGFGFYAPHIDIHTNDGTRSADHV